MRLIAIVVVLLLGSSIKAQETPNPLPTEIAQLSSTPVQIEIVTSTPLPIAVDSPTPSYTPSPEVQSVANLQARQDAGDINVRAEPDIEADILGQISYGDLYVVTGRYFRWYRFRYDAVPSGIGWVFEELVEVTGNVDQIPDLSQTPQATENATLIASTANAAGLLLTPGGALTATAQVREIQGPVAVVDGGDTVVSVEAQQTILPTFTYPPQIALLPTNEPFSSDETLPPSSESVDPTETVPPIIPIVVLGGFGLLGLAVSSLRR